MALNDLDPARVEALTRHASIIFTAQSHAAAVELAMLLAQVYGLTTSQKLEFLSKCGIDPDPFDPFKGQVSAA